jgi:hypothetical protein
MDNPKSLDGLPARGRVIKKLVDGKEMLLVEVNRRKYPFEHLTWGKWNYKISNFEHVKNKIKEGDTVEGHLFRFKLLPRNHAARFHIQSVLPIILSQTKVQP